MQYKLFLILLMTFLLLANSCSTEDENIVKSDIQIRLKSSPDRLMPLLSKSSYASQIERYLNASLYVYDEQSSQLIPYLADGIVQKERVDSFYKYTYRIREDAHWSGKEKITAEDYLFTLKWALNPVVQNSGLGDYLSLIDSVQLYQNEPRKFTVWLNESYFLAEEALGLLPILPQQHYDPKKMLNEIHLSHISKINQGSKLYEYFIDIENSSLGRDSVYGAGPYKLTEWQSDQFIKLERKEDWWGEDLKLPIIPHSEIQEISYLIIPDDLNAQTMFKMGELDILTGINSYMFNEIIKTSDTLKFYHPSTSRYYYLSINNLDPLLSHIEIRQVIDALIDKEGLIQNQLEDRARIITGPIHPNSSYAIELPVVKQNINNAKEILDRNGWIDLDQDGVREKEIDGRKVELRTSIEVSKGKLGQTIALMLKENAARIGFDIDIITTDFSLIRQKLLDKTYHMTPLVMKTSGMSYDPYQSWHSENSIAGKSNYSAIRDTSIDRYIKTIRFDIDENNRKQAYVDFQNRIDQMKPVIFIAAPEELIVTQHSVNIIESQISPGYFLQSIE